MTILLGDLHNNTTYLKSFIDIGYAENGTIIHLGDLVLWDIDDLNILNRGLIKEINDLLVEKNTTLKLIRGNHDNPKYWLDEDIRVKFMEDFSNIKLIPDFTIENINDLDVMFIGGAVSIDREVSKECFVKTGKEIWWADEVTKLPEDGLKSLPTVDIVVAHNCPSFFNLDIHSESVKRYSANDPELIDDLVEERSLMDLIFHKVKPKTWFSGHYHNNMRGTEHGCCYRCLDIAEAFPLKSLYVEE